MKEIFGGAATMGALAAEMAASALFFLAANVAGFGIQRSAVSYQEKPFAEAASGWLVM